MGTYKVCDRCGKKIQEVYHPRTYEIKHQNLTDLCHECYLSIVKFIERGENG